MSNNNILAQLEKLDHDYEMANTPKPLKIQSSPPRCPDAPKKQKSQHGVLCVVDSSVKRQLFFDDK